MSSQQTWLTQEAADRLAAELAHLEGPGRKEITAKIEAARAEGVHHNPRTRLTQGLPLTVDWMRKHYEIGG